VGRKIADCRRFESDSNCSLTIIGEEDEVIASAAQHAVTGAARARGELRTGHARARAVSELTGEGATRASTVSAGSRGAPGAGGVRQVIGDTPSVRISVAVDELTGVAGALLPELERRGHHTLAHGALADGERNDWAWASEAVARDVADGRAEQGIVCCWTGTGASIAANKLQGVRAALCLDAPTAAGAREWNDANVLALSLRTTSDAQLGEILDAWFATAPSGDAEDRANVEHLAQIERGL
jgi:ribose 5-phosphate isomerase B